MESLMEIYRKQSASGGTLAMLLACCLYLPSASAGELSGTEWKVTRGDTLYAIGRAVYPGNTAKQARLRQDIMRLNPSIFANGANNMSVGVVLILPDYVSTKSAPPNVARPIPVPIPDKVAPRPATPSANAVKFGGTQWQVMRGDSLYTICRTIYPQDARQQARLGWDIKKLNPSVFANGQNEMGVGVALKLPDYVSPDSVPSRVGGTGTVIERTVPAPMPPEKVTPSPAPQQVAPAQVVESQPKSTTVKRQADSTPSRSEGGAVVSLGYSYGGDKLVDVIDGADIFAGNGLQLRIGYEQMFQQGSGYRASLGLQYYTLLNQNASYKDAYLQLAYQYRANPLIYGIGVVYDAGATLEVDSTTVEYDPAVGAVVYLENVGSGLLSGLGLSVTSLNIEGKSSSTSIGASRAELYYSWRF